MNTIIEEHRSVVILFCVLSPQLEAEAVELFIIHKELFDTLFDLFLSSFDLLFDVGGVFLLHLLFPIVYVVLYAH